MDYLDAVLLGAIQGVAEFLPISSSGHLVIADALLREVRGGSFDPKRNLQLNVAVHLGTLLSILVVYRRDLLPLFRNGRLCLLIGLASIPIVATGLTLREVIEESLFSPLVAGLCLFITAGLLAWADFSPGGDGTTQTLTFRQAGIVGLFQALALLPGVSRSGSTIAGGLLTGLRPDDSARFSFFIAIPAIAGAVVLTAKDVVQESAQATPLPVLLVGAGVAFLVGWGSLRVLLRLVRRRQLRWFAWYCGFAGGATVIWQLTTQ